MKFQTDDDKAKFLMKRMSWLEQIRQPVEAMVDEVIKFVNHSRRKIVDKDLQKGQKTGIDVYDGTAMSAANLAADGIHGYECNRSTHWFDFVLPGKLNFPRSSLFMRQWDGKRLDDHPEVKVWLDDCEEVQYYALNRSNFYEFHPDFVREGITLGTPTAIIEEDIKAGRIIFTLPHFRECYIAENHLGMVDTLFRKRKYDLRQLVQKFGKETIFEMNADFKQQYESNPYTEHEVIHAIFPRTDYDPSKLNGANKPVASFYLMPNTQKKIISESGYFDLPTVTWRWRKNSDEWYGRSPAWDAYIAIMTANQQGKTNLVAGHKMADPPMQGSSDLRGKVRNAPGGWTWIDGPVTKDKVAMPLVTGIQLPYSLEMQDRTAKIIKEYFHVDFFLMLHQAAFAKVNLTATQVIGMQGEQAAVLGTRIGRLESEGMNPMHDRVFEIEVRAGRMPMPPQIVLDMAQGQRIEVDYLGVLSQAQKKLFQTQRIQAGIQMAKEIGEVFPDSLDRIDPDKLMDEAMESVGFPAKVIRPDDEIIEIRRARQAAQQQERDLMAIQELAKSAKDLSGEIQPGSGIDVLSGGAISEQGAA